MDTAVLALLILLVLSMLVNLYLLVRSPQKSPELLNRDQLWIRQLATEQILENRRLVNLTLSKDPMMFHALSAVNPENQGTSQLTEHPEAENLKLVTPQSYGSSDGRDPDEIYETLGDEGFDGSFDRLPK